MNNKSVVIGWLHRGIWVRCGRVAGTAALFLILQSAIHLYAQSTNDEAAEYMERIGAILSRDDRGRAVSLQFPEGLGLNQQGWPKLSLLKDLRELDLGALALPNEAIAHIAPLSELRTLNLFGNPIDSIALTNIVGMKHLETLYLYRTFVDDEAIESIAKLPKLRRLNMFDTFLTDKGLDQIGDCKQLRYLSIGNSKAGKFPESFFTKSGIERLRKNLPNTEITLWGADRLDKPKVLQLHRISSESSKRTPVAELSVEVKFAPDLSKRSFGTDWPSFLGSSGNGKSPDVGLIKSWSTNPPKLLWQKKIGEGYSAPTVSRGRLFLFHRVRTTGSTRFKERLDCFESETGKEIWHVDFSTGYEDLNGYGDGPRSSPVVDGDRVYLLSPSGDLRCLQALNGRLLWQVDLVKRFSCPMPTYGFGSTPLVDGNVLLIVAGSEYDSDQQTAVICLDKKNGVFRYGVGRQPASYASPVITSQGGRRWGFAFTQDGLLGFNPDTGSFDFEFGWNANVAGCVNAATPTIRGNEVFITEGYRIGGAKLRFSSAQAETVWQDDRRVRQKKMACHWASPILHQGFLYGCSGRHRSDAMLKCIDWFSGNTLWQSKMPDRSSLTYVDGHLLNLGENGVLTLVRATPKGYAEVGRLDKQNAKVVPSYPAWSAPVVAKGLMYLRGKHELICYDLL